MIPFNVLITSISKKIPLIKAIRRSLESLKLKGSIFGGDHQSQCLGRYFVDKFWEMPQEKQLSIQTIIRYCNRHKIQAVIPTRDGELSFYAQHQSELLEQEITCLISTKEAVGICCDKVQFFHYLYKHRFPTIMTEVNLKEPSFPSYVVKERFGAGTRSIGLNLPFTQAKEWAKDLKHPIFQPYINGEEYSIDLYVDRSRNCKGVIARKRELVVNGESQITTSVKYAELEKLCAEVAIKIGLYGHAVFQVFSDINGQFHIIECNPRFGGASTLSLAMGLKSFEWFFLETLKQTLPEFVRASQEKRQVRYPEDLILEI